MLSDLCGNEAIFTVLYVENDNKITLQKSIYINSQILNASL